MANRPVIEVGVNDAAFQQFIELWNSYNAQLGEQQGTWNALNEAMGGAGEALKSGAVSGRDALSQAAEQAERVNGGLRQAVQGQTILNRATEASHSSLRAFGRTATGLSKTVSGAAKASISEIGAGITGIAETAAAALGPVGIAAAAIATVVGATGAAAKALADAAVTRQRSAFSKGITPGQEASFGVYAQQFMDADALQAAANNQTSFASAGQLATLGIDFNAARKMSASDLAYAKLKAALSAAQASPDIPLDNLPAIQAYKRLGGQIGDVRNAQKMGPAELAASQDETNRNARRLDLNTTAVQRAAGFKKGVEALGIQAQSAGINTAYGTIPDAVKNPAADLATVGTVLQHVGTTIVQHVDPALHALKEAAAGAASTLQGIEKSFTSPIAGTAAAAVVEAAKKAGVDPILALADAQHESGMNPKARVRDFYSDGEFAGYSTGLFQLNDNGEGKGMSVKDMMDPLINATVAMKNFATVAKTHPDWSPGEIAFAAEGAARGPKTAAHPLGEWRDSYIADVNAKYAAMTKSMRMRPSDALAKVADVMKERPASVLDQFSRAARAANPKLTHAQLMALAGTPGEIDAVALHPKDPYAFATSVNARYAKLVKQMRNSKPPTVNVKVSNPTQSRVSVSINAAALGAQ